MPKKEEYPNIGATAQPQDALQEQANREEPVTLEQEPDVLLDMLQEEAPDGEESVFEKNDFLEEKIAVSDEATSDLPEPVKEPEEKQPEAAPRTRRNAAPIQPLTGLANTLGALLLCYVILSLSFGYAADKLVSIPWLATLLDGLGGLLPPLLCIYLGRFLLGRKKQKPMDYHGNRGRLLGMLLCTMPIILVAFNLIASGVKRLLTAALSPEPKAPTDTASWLIFLLFSCILVPLAEEWFYRGVLQPSLYPYGERFAVIVTSLLFALMNFSLVEFVPYYLMSCFIGYAAVVFGRYQPCVLLHIINSVLTVLLTYGVQGMNGISALGMVMVILVICLIVGIYGIYELRRCHPPVLKRRSDPRNKQSRFELMMIAPVFTAALVALIAQMLLQTFAGRPI